VGPGQTLTPGSCCAGTAEEFDQRLPFATVGACLEPLEASDRRVAEVLARIRDGGGEPGPVLRDLIDGAAGNPLYINELVGAPAREMRLYVAGTEADIKPGPDDHRVPPTLRVAVTRRLELLSAGVRELLKVAALLGTTFSVADVSAVLGRPGTSLLGSVREATEGGVLTELPGRLAFRHPLVRTVLDNELPASAHQALHLQIACPGHRVR
jgi:predicted ATPase